MNSERFVASRWTIGNRIFPTVIEVGDQFVTCRKRSWFSKNEISIHLRRVASVRIQSGIMFADILIESSGGTDPIRSHGHRKSDAERMKALIESRSAQF